MTQKPLELIQVDAISQLTSGKAMAQIVDACALNAGRGAYPSPRFLNVHQGPAR